MAETHTPDRKTKVFVSYSRKDREAVRRLAAALEGDGEIDVLLDTEDILPTEEWRSRLEGLIAQADTIVFCLTPRSATSPVCAWEVATAEGLNKRIAPVVIEEVDGQVPESLAKLNYIFFTGRDDFDTALARLREALDADIDWIREHTRLGELARRWDADGRRRTDLLRGQSLAAAEAWLINRPAKAPAPTALHRDFARESRRAASRRKNWWIVGSTSVAVGATALAALAYWQRGIAVEQRTAATARQLSAEAQVVLADPLAKPETAVRDLLMSLSLSPSEAALEALAVGASRLEPRPLGALPWPNGAKPPRLMSVSPDGAWLAVVTVDEALFWDLTARRMALRQPLRGVEDAPSLAFTDDGAKALVTEGTAPGSSSATWTAIDLASGRTETAASGDALDVAVVGSDILALLKLEDGVAIADFMTGSVRERVASGPSSGAPVFGHFFGEARAASPLAAMVVPGAGIEPPPPRQMILLVDAQGLASTVTIGERGVPVPLTLPEGASPLAVDATGGLLAVRQPGAGDAVLRLPAGEVAWQAPGGAESFRGFAGSGRFVLVQDDLGARLESIGGGISVGVDPGRKTDYDLSALGDLAQYTPIVAVEVASQSGLIVTARRDGRVAVWRPEMRPRYGAIGAMPMPSFAPVASFDHGDTLGVIEPFWSAPPVLFVSSDGRYVASQSLGIKTNTVGGVTSFAPLVRIWDSRYAKEIARFRPDAPMLVGFAPARSLMVTMTAGTPAAAGTGEPDLALALWDLSDLTDRGPPAEEALATRIVHLTPAAVDGQDVEAADGTIAALAAPVWLDAKRRLLALDAESGTVAVVDDLAAPLGETARRMDAYAQASDRHDDQVRLLAHMGAALVAGPPFLVPVAVSADGRRAAVALGPSVRLYALDAHPRLIASFAVGPAGLALPPLPLGLALSPEGDAFAVEMVVPPDHDAPPPTLPGAPEGMSNATFAARLMVYRTDGVTGPVHDLAELAFVPFSPAAVGLHRLKRLVALGPKGGFLVIDETTLDFGHGPPTAEARLRLIDLTDGQDLLALPPRELSVIMAMMEADFAMPPVAAFDVAGTRMVAMQERADCPMMRETAASLVPVAVPSCPDRRTTLSLWSVKSGTPGQRIAATGFVTRPAAQVPAPAAVPAAAIAMMTGMSASGLYGPRINFDRREPPGILLEGVTTRMAGKGDELAIEMTETRRRIALGAGEPAVDDACARLPRALARPDEATWAAIAPAEAFRRICPQEDRQRPDDGRT